MFKAVMTVSIAIATLASVSMATALSAQMIAAPATSTALDSAARKATCGIHYLAPGSFGYACTVN